MDLDSINEVINDMANEIARLEEKLAEREWIPCSERLPTRDDGDGVLVSTTKAFGGLVEVISIWTSSVELYYQKGWVTAWMPLPQPYRGDDK